MNKSERIDHEKKRIIDAIEDLDNEASKGYQVFHYQKKYVKEIESTDEERKKALIDLFKSTDNIFFQALFFYTKWKTKSLKNYKDAIEAAKLFEEAADIAFQNDWYFLIHFNLEMALHINKSLKYEDEVQKLVQKNILFMKKNYQNKEFGWNIGLINSFLIYGNFENGNRIEEVFDLTKQTLDELYNDKESHHLLEPFTKLALELNKKRQDEEIKKELISRLANHYIEFCSLAEESAITKLDALKKAMDLYDQIDAKEEKDKIKVKMKSLKDDLLKEMKILKIEIPYNKQIINEFIEIAENTNSNQFLGTFGSCSYFTPDKKIIKDMLESNPSLSERILPGIMLDQGNPISEIKNSEEWLQYDINDFYKKIILKGIGEIRLIMEKLIENDLINHDDIIEFLKENSDVFTEESLKFIKDGIERYFNGDFIGSIHILIPQIEAAIRFMMQNAHIPTTIQIRDGILEGDINHYLKDPAVKQNILGENFSFWLRILLTEKIGGLNLRNNLAHGLIEYDSLNCEIVSGILFIFLKLGCLRIKKS